jgi:methyl acetate hydrolase
MTNPTRRLAARALVIASLASIAAAVARHPLAAAAPALSRQGEEAIGALLRQKVAAGMPAIAVIVVNPQRQLFLGAAGQRDAAAHAPLTTDTIFRIASMTKAVTSLATMMLVEEGRFGVDDPLAKYLPEFERVRVLTAFSEADGRVETRAPSRPITIRHLLTHTSGIVYPFVDARLAKMNTAGKPQAEIPLIHDPGERFTYGPNTAVLGSLVAKVSGRPLEEFLKTRIFDPIGMTDTFYAVPPEKHARVVTLQTRSGDGFAERANPATLAAPVAGDGGLFSTAADYGRFMQVFLNGGRAGTTRLVSESTIRQMLSNQIGRLVVEQQPSADPARAKPFPIGGGKDKFGFGFQIEAAPAGNGLRSVGSGSWGGINNTHFWIDPRRQIASAVLMQVLPYYDAAAIDVLRSVERAIYRHLRSPS